MIVERKDNELLVRLKLGTSAERTQALLDFLRYEELTANSTATKESTIELLDEVKRGRWKQTKERIGLDD